MEKLKQAAMNGLFAFWLAASSPQQIHGFESPPAQEVVSQDEYLRQAMIQNIYEKSGIEIIADYDPELSAALGERYPSISSSENFSPSLEMVQTADSVFNLVPAAGFMAQNVIFLNPLPGERGVIGGYLHDFQDEGWIALIQNPNTPLSRPHPETQHLNIPDYGTRMALTLMHELAHGFHSNVLYLQTYNMEQFTIDRLYPHLNPLDPILRTYAEVAGFEFIEPEVICSQETGEEVCWKDNRFLIDPSVPIIRNMDGWVRTEKSASQTQITVYGGKSFPFESFAEDSMGYLSNPSFYNPNMQQYFENIFSGLASAEDPGHFLLAVAQDPEGILLK